MRQAPWMNARSMVSERNAQAAALAGRVGRRTYVAADSHFARSIGNAVLEVERRESVEESLRRGQIRWIRPSPSPTWALEASQLFQARSSGRPAAAAMRLAKLMREAARSRVSRFAAQDSK